MTKTTYTALQTRFRDLLDYNASTGVLLRRQARGPRLFGTIAGHLGRDGYRYIMVDHRRYTAQRLIWVYVTGEWPSGLIDHKDQNRDNNRWMNLRIATHSQNAVNTGLPKNNTSGVKGVTWNSRSHKWQATGGGRSNRKYLGLFDDLSEAQKTVAQFNRATYGQFIPESAPL